MTQRRQSRAPPAWLACTRLTHQADYSAWMRLGSNGVTGYKLCAHSADHPRQRRDGIEHVSEIARDIYPQFHMFPMGVWVQQGPKPPPFHRPL
jgi:hypothetical protein